MTQERKHEQKPAFSLRSICRPASLIPRRVSLGRTFLSESSDRSVVWITRAAGFHCVRL
jgi:hypothetical protein